MLSEYALSCANAETLRLSEVNYTIKELERIVNYSGVSLKAIIRTQILTPRILCELHFERGLYCARFR